jgi:hypothetical protein
MGVGDASLCFVRVRFLGCGTCAIHCFGFTANGICRPTLCGFRPSERRVKNRALGRQRVAAPRSQHRVQFKLKRVPRAISEVVVERKDANYWLKTGIGILHCPNVSMSVR